jgi:hypothetical protein
VTNQLNAQGVMVETGTLVDATLIASASVKAEALRAPRAAGIGCGSWATSSPTKLTASRRPNSTRRPAADAARRACEVAPVIAELNAAGASLGRIAAALAERDFPAPGGGAWSAVQVSRALARGVEAS